MSGFQVPTCTCGHVLGSHLSGGQSLYATSQGGRCMTTGCECRAFVRAVPQEKAA